MSPGDGFLPGDKWRLRGVNGRVVRNTLLAHLVGKKTSPEWVFPLPSECVFDLLLRGRDTPCRVMPCHPVSLAVEVGGFSARLGGTVACIE